MASLSIGYFVATIGLPLNKKRSLALAHDGRRYTKRSATVQALV